MTACLLVLKVFGVDPRGVASVSFQKVFQRVRIGFQSGGAAFAAILDQLREAMVSIAREVVAQWLTTKPDLDVNPRSMENLIWSLWVPLVPHLRFWGLIIRPFRRKFAQGISSEILPQS